ncbi:hypothetical protein ACLOJK_017577 [Asimina triloba]
MAIFELERLGPDIKIRKALKRRAKFEQRSRTERANLEHVLLSSVWTPEKTVRQKFRICGEQRGSQFDVLEVLGGSYAGTSELELEPGMCTLANFFQVSAYHH